MWGREGKLFKKWIYGHFSQNSSKHQSLYTKGSWWIFFFLFHMDNFFSVTQIKCSLSAATLSCQILYFSEECFMFSSWHISILMQLLHFYTFQFYRIRLCFLMFYLNLNQTKASWKKKGTQYSLPIPTYHQPYKIFFNDI